MILSLVLSRSSSKGRMISAARLRASIARLVQPLGGQDGRRQPGKIGTGSSLFEVTWKAIITSGIHHRKSPWLLGGGGGSYYQAWERFLKSVGENIHSNRSRTSQVSPYLVIYGSSLNYEATPCILFNRSQWRV